jgi:uncharacterized protein HemX
MARGARQGRRWRAGGAGGGAAAGALALAAALALALALVAGVQAQVIIVNPTTDLTLCGLKKGQC